MITPATFKNSSQSLLVFENEAVIFESSNPGLQPMFDFYNQFVQVTETGVVKLLKSDLTIYDRYIGRASAFLISLLHPVFVYTPVISQFGKMEFEKAGTKYQADKEVKYLMGEASAELCRWEKLTVGMKADEFIVYLKKEGYLK